MANRERGEVAIEVGGTSYTLVLTTNAMCELEDLLSTPEKVVTFHEALKRVVRNDVRAIRGMVWASARRHHPNLTIEQAGDLIERAGGVIAFTPTLSMLMQSTQPDKGGSVNGRPLKAQTTSRGTGTPSTSKPGASV